MNSDLPKNQGVEMRARFIGRGMSAKGFNHGKVYNIVINNDTVRKRDGTALITYPSIHSFLLEWSCTEQKAPERGAISKYDYKTGKYLGSYHTIAQASKDIGVTHSAVAHVVRGSSKQCRGFIFSHEHISNYYKNGKELKGTQLLWI
jgi:hypothetical protein